MCCQSTALGCESLRNNVHEWLCKQVLVQGMTKRAIRRLAHQSGIKKIRFDIHKQTQLILEALLDITHVACSFAIWFCSKL